MFGSEGGFSGGWLGAGGVASEASRSTARKIRPAAAGIPRKEAARVGHAPVLWADRLYAWRSGVRWMPSADALAHGALA